VARTATNMTAEINMSSVFAQTLSMMKQM